MNSIEERVSDLEDIIMKITQSGQHIESQIKKKKESNIRDIWYDIKHADTLIIGIPEGKEEED